MTHRPPSDGLRRAVEVRTLPLLAALARRPPAVFGVFLALLLVTFFVAGLLSLLPGVLLVAFLGLFTYLGWPVLPPRDRAVRGGVLGIVAALVVLHALRRI